MGRTAKHNEQEVFEAADKLAATGQEVTPSLLREALGGGSLTTIYRHHAAWVAQRAQAPVEPTLPMPDSVKTASDAFWQAASAAASKEITAIREKADSEVKAAQRGLEEAIESIARIEGEVESESARADQLTEQLAELRDTTQQAATDATAREASLNATVVQLQAQLAEAREQGRDARESASSAAKERDSARGTLARVEEDLQQLQQQLKEATETARLAAMERDSARGTLTQLRDELASATAELREVQGRERSASESLASVSAQLRELQQHCAANAQRLESEKAGVSEELATSRDMTREALARADRADGELVALRRQVQDQAVTIKDLQAGKPGAKSPSKPRGGGAS